MDAREIREHLQGREQQLDALIKLLEHTGEKHPQYGQLEKCKKDYETVINQLTRLNKQYAAQFQATDK